MAWARKSISLDLVRDMKGVKSVEVIMIGGKRAGFTIAFDPRLGLENISGTVLTDLALMAQGRIFDLALDGVLRKTKP